MEKAGILLNKLKNPSRFQNEAASRRKFVEDYGYTFPPNPSPGPIERTANDMRVEDAMSGAMNQAQLDWLKINGIPYTNVKTVKPITNVAINTKRPEHIWDLTKRNYHLPTLEHYLSGPHKEFIDLTEIKQLARHTGLSEESIQHLMNNKSPIEITSIGDLLEKAGRTIPKDYRILSTTKAFKPWGEKYNPLIQNDRIEITRPLTPDTHVNIHAGGFALGRDYPTHEVIGKGMRTGKDITSPPHKQFEFIRPEDMPDDLSVIRYLRKLFKVE